MQRQMNSEYQRPRVLGRGNCLGKIRYTRLYLACARSAFRQYAPQIARVAILAALAKLPCQVHRIEHALQEGDIFQTYDLELLPFFRMRTNSAAPTELLTGRRQV